jgi:HAD superfamily hydrolase (TIGR01450 family)
MNRRSEWQPDTFRSWLRQHHLSLDGLILDIDGVLLKGGHCLPGSGELLDMLDDLNLAYILLTNDGNHSPEQKAARLQRAGLMVAPDEIISCGHAIAPLAHEKGLIDQPFFVMGDTGDPCYVAAAGLKPIRELEQLNTCAGVVVGEDRYNWEPVINAVVNFFIDAPRAPFIVPNPDEFYPGRILKIHVAAGGIARFIQNILHAYGLVIDPIYLGKPYSPIFNLAHHHMGLRTGAIIPKDRILMVGDNACADIAGGQNAGFRTALLLTGVTTRSALSVARVRPDLIFESL